MEFTQVGKQTLSKNEKLMLIYNKEKYRKVFISIDGMNSLSGIFPELKHKWGIVLTMCGGSLVGERVQSRGNFMYEGPEPK